MDEKEFDVSNNDSPSSSEKVKQEYVALNSILDNLETNISNLVTRQEHEFLDAFDVHMRRMREEFKSVRDEIEEKERKLTQNEHVKKLEKECNWYRNEAFQLDQMLNVAKKSEKCLREKVADLEDEKTW